MRTFRGIAALALAVALVASVGGCKQVDAVAKVNGEAITRVEFDRIYDQVQAQMGGSIAEDVAADYKRQLLDMMIETVLITQEAEKLGADLSEEAVDTGMQEIMGESDPAEFEQQVIDAGLTMEDLRKSVRDQLAREYLSQKASEESSSGTLPETYSLLSHILVNDETLANDLYTDIENGGDFAALASQNSSDTASAIDGGSLGWAPTSAYVPEFADAADLLKVGEVSKPVKSDYGWHIIRKVDEAKQGDAVTDAPEELQDLISANGAEIALQEYVARLREDADIVYVDEALKPAE